MYAIRSYYGSAGPAREEGPITDLKTQTPDPVKHLSSALQALNTHLTEHALLPGGIMPPAHLDLDEWVV